MISMEDITRRRVIIISILSFFLIVLTFYVQATGFGRVYTHLFYIPIILACIWWQKKGIALALAFGVFLLATHAFLRPDIAISNDVLRSIVFIIIALFVAGMRRKEGDSKKSLEKTTTKLNKSNEYLNKLLDYANAPIIVWDNQKKITLFNNAFAFLTGYKKSFAIGKEVCFLFAAKDKKEYRAIIDKATAGQKWENVEIAIQCKNKDSKILLWNSASITDKAGNILATIAQGTDITDRKLLEKNQEKIILERTKELQSKVDELEKFHRVAIDRELKMIEMKNVINGMRNSSEQKKKE